MRRVHGNRGKHYTTVPMLPEVDQGVSWIPRGRSITPEQVKMLSMEPCCEFYKLVKVNNIQFRTKRSCYIPLTYSFVYVPRISVCMCNYNTSV